MAEANGLSPTATGALISPKKSPRAHFKTPDGRYRLIGEFSTNIPSHSQRLTASRGHQPSTAVSLISYGHMEEELSGEDSDSDGSTPNEQRDKRPRRNIGVLLNAGHAIYMYDYWHPLDPARHVEKFRTIPTAHNFNYYTSSSQRLDLVVGFQNGSCAISDSLSDDPTTQFFNANGAITTSEVTRVKWLPRSSRLFIAAHADGNMYVYDRDRTVEQAIPLPARTDGEKSSRAGLGTQVIKNPLGKDKAKCNPVCVWHISSKQVSDFTFSQDGVYFATVSHDGWLRVFDYAKETHIVSFRSYYGALVTVAWSTDGKFLLTGGQDDLISIWAFDERCLVARCRGHSSYVTSVAFDPWSTHFDQTYVFGSVGHDCNLLMWEFSVGALHRSRKSTLSREVSSPAIPKPSSGPQIVPAPGRSDVPILGPIGSMQAHADLCSHIIFLEDALVTTAVDGNCRIWARPSKLLRWGRRAAAAARGDDELLDDTLEGGDHLAVNQSGVSERSAADIDLSMRTPGKTPARNRGTRGLDVDSDEDPDMPTPLKGMRARDREDRDGRVSDEASES